MFTKTFFKLFPPPKFLNEPYAGIDISDGAVRCIQLAPGRGKSGKNGNRVVEKYGLRLLPPGIVEAGFVKDKAKLIAVVAELARELNLDRVRSSLPEEEMYIFKASVPMKADRKTMAQTIEFKIEENVPLSAADAIFYFDTIPGTESPSTGTISTGVAVAPRKVVETYLDVLTGAGLTVISFEMQARALARAFMKKDHTSETVLIVYILKHKIGMYVIYDNVACFTSTIPRGDDIASSVSIETQKICDYWAERGEGRKEIDRIILSGQDALLPDLPHRIVSTPSIHADIANVWGNVFSGDSYIPPIPADEALDYAVAVGLAL
jgi:Tfp pilus assembly PilM family ATPase